MDEAFLHYVWKFQKFNVRELATTEGERVTVLNPGQTHNNAGPDFSEARIKLGDISWTGQVEIHINAKDWNRHRHENDPAYNNVILHVVWKNDLQAKRKDGTIIPTLEVKDLIDENLLLKYQKSFDKTTPILCHSSLPDIKSITWISMLEKALAERLEQKSELVFKELGFTGGDWEEVAWRLLCKNFGFKTNAHPFYELGKSIPFNIIKKESYDQIVVEAILFGQAGFLEGESDDPYFGELKGQYEFKRSKYGLDRRLEEHHWKFLRLRPANFPTIRISQLASLSTKNPNLFATLVDESTIKELKKQFECEQAPYWRKHYHFGKESKSSIGRFGKNSIENILINTAAPLIFAYGIHKDNEEYKERAVDLLASLPAERNSIINEWVSYGKSPSSAFESQGQLGLFQLYCTEKKCLNCSVGIELLNATSG